MSHRTFAVMDPEQRKQVIDDIYKQLAPVIEKSVNTIITQYVEGLKPDLQAIVRAEVGKWAVTEKHAMAFLDGMMATAAQKAAALIRPRWLARILFRAYE